MARRFPIRGSATLLFIFLLLCRIVTGESEINVVLEMPSYTLRGSSITLLCRHNIQPEMLYKVEWMKAGKKIVQYIRERRPQFVTHHVQGAHLNMSQATERSIILQDLDFSASGSYSCEVSLNTPIYTKSSTHRELQVIQPQKHQPKIKFGAPMYTLDDILEATCTTSAAYPAPHITWLVNGEKVDVTLVESYIHPEYQTKTRNKIKAIKNSLLGPIPLPNSPHNEQRPLKSSNLNDICKDPDTQKPNMKITRQVDESLTIPSTSNHHRISGSHELLASSTTKLSVAVSSLRLAPGGKLSLTCLASIPAYRSPNSYYADLMNQTVTVDVIVAEEPEITTTDLIFNGESIPLPDLIVTCILCMYQIKELLRQFLD